MKNSRKWIALAGVGLVVMILAVVALPAAAANDAPAPVFHRNGPGGFGNQDTYLANALGITVEELQAAQESARLAGIQQAVDEGLITQAQADALQARGRFDLLRMMGRFVGADNVIDGEALLADALGISVDELQAARQAAAEAALQQAVEDGRITQEQADLMQARQALGDYLNAQGLRESMQALYENAVQGAVEAGVITQEQADVFLSNQGRFGGGRGFDGFGGHGGMRLPGGLRGMTAPNGNAAPSGLFQRGGAGFGVSL